MKALFKIRSTAREHSEDQAVRRHRRADPVAARLPARHPRQGAAPALAVGDVRQAVRALYAADLGSARPAARLIFCNCEGYVTATEHNFDDYLAWVRKSQIDTNFFYAASGHSVIDIQYVTSSSGCSARRQLHSSPAVTVDEPGGWRRRGPRPCEGQERPARNGGAGRALQDRPTSTRRARPAGDGKYLLWATQQIARRLGRGRSRTAGGGRGRGAACVAATPRPPSKRKPALERGSVRARTRSRAAFLGNYGRRDRDPSSHGAAAADADQRPGKGAGRSSSTLRPASGIARFQGLGANPGGGARGVRARRRRLPQPGLHPPGAAQYRPVAGRRYRPVSPGVPRRHGGARRDCLGTCAETIRAAGGCRRGTGRPRKPRRPSCRRSDMSEIDIVLQSRTNEDRDAPTSLDDGPGERGIDAMANYAGRDPGIRASGCWRSRRCAGAARRDNLGRDHFGFADGISQPKPVGGPAAPHRRRGLARAKYSGAIRNSRTDARRRRARFSTTAPSWSSASCSQEVGRLRRVRRAGNKATANRGHADIDSGGAAMPR